MFDVLDGETENNKNKRGRIRNSYRFFNFTAYIPNLFEAECGVII